MTKITKSKRINKPLMIVMLVMIAVTAVFAAVSVISGAGLGNIGAWFPLMYCLLLFFVTYNRNNLKKWLKKAYNPLIFLFYLGMTAFVVAFMIFCVLIIGYSSDNIDDIGGINPDLTIVLGCQVFGYTPGKMLKHRLDSAVEVVNKYPDVICIVTGGQGPDEIIPEAVAMGKYLTDRGIESYRIYEEDKSSSSFENLIFSKTIVQENNLSHETIIIVTSNYHIPRAMMITNRIYPDSEIYAVKAHTPLSMFGAGLMREFFAFMKSFLVDRV